MKLITRLLFVISIFGVQSLKAKSIAADSADVSRTDTANTKPAYNKSMQKAAVRDTRSFKLPAEQVAAFKKGKISQTSDYFKPTAAYTSDPKMLSDSSYVKEFRAAAYHRSSSHSSGKAFLIVGGVIVAFAGLFVLAYEIFGAR